MVINTVANHKLHAARTCGSRQRKSSAELEGAAALDMSLPSGKAPEGDDGGYWWLLVSSKGDIKQGRSFGKGGCFNKIICQRKGGYWHGWSMSTWLVWDLNNKMQISSIKHMALSMNWGARCRASKTQRAVHCDEHSPEDRKQRKASKLLQVTSNQEKLKPHGNWIGNWRVPSGKLT